jgi:hypothetical protein
VKKLKSLDIPDLVKSVKNHKLPKEALRSIIPRFNINEGKLELIESKETLKKNAEKDL